MNSDFHAACVVAKDALGQTRRHMYNLQRQHTFSATQQARYEQITATLDALSKVSVYTVEHLDDMLTRLVSAGAFFGDLAKVFTLDEFASQCAVMVKAAWKSGYDVLKANDPERF